MSAYRCGTVGIAGRPNTGKSTLLNRLVGEKLAIVSPKAQTTRHLVTGILTGGSCQFIFVDSPGLQAQHRSALHRTLNRRAREATVSCDVVAVVFDALHFSSDDGAILSRIPQKKCVVAVVNKLDRVAGSAKLMPFLDRLSREHDFHAIVPVSARSGENLPELLKVLESALPEASAVYPAEQLTDRDERFFAAELLREKLFQLLGEELPYCCEAVIDSFREEGSLRRIEATILVERDSQKAIVIGAGGLQLKRIGQAARKDMERLFGGKVYLGVWVKVRRGWTDDERVLRQLGYEI